MSNNRLFPRLAFAVLLFLSLCSGLQAGARYRQLPIGSIKAEGWLLEMLLRQRDGATGHMDELYPQVMGSRNGWLGGDGDQWERGPYWIDGLLPLAYILDDEALKAKVRPWVEHILASQREDGQFGPSQDYSPEPGVQRNNSLDWWPRMVALKIMQQYYQATGDERVIGFLTRYFHYQLRTLPSTPLGRWTFWATYRYGDNIQVAGWLYDITGDEKLLELTDLLYSQGVDFTKMFESGDVFKGLRTIHCVNLAQGFKTPIVYGEHRPSERYEAATAKAWVDLRRLCGQAQGLFGGDEGLHGANPTQGVELCSVVEMMFSLESMLRISGNTLWADELERVAYNALPAQVSDDFMYKQYFQQANQVRVSRERRNFFEDDGHGHTDVIFGTRSGYPCCYSNMHQGWPKLVQNLWYESADGGLSALVFAPCRVEKKLSDGRVLSIREDTCYPMEGTVRFRIGLKGKKAANFALSVRVPGWCSAPVLTLNGETVVAEPAEGMLSLQRDWKNGDVLELELPMGIRFNRWYENSVSVERGPLVYALKMNEVWERREFSEADRVFGTEYWEVSSEDKWNYALLNHSISHAEEDFEVIIDKERLGSRFIWNPKGNAITLRTRAKEVPEWTIYENSAGPLPFSVRNCSSPETVIELIPYGCTALRISEFPVVR